MAYEFGNRGAMYRHAGLTHALLSGDPSRSFSYAPAMHRLRVHSSEGGIQ
jgi:hypothetical protein